MPHLRLLMDGFAIRLDAPAGLRVAVKDLIDMSGLPTTAGSAAVDPVPAASDAACLTGVRAAAVIVGRTVLHELAYGITGVNAWQGTPTNPLDRGRVPGGSSSGAAVVVANGDADVAIGTDTGGSVRLPAACCGIAGLKTTWGRVPIAGVRPLAPTMDTIGPLARDVAGLIEGMQLLEPGFLPGEPATSIGRLRPAVAPGVDAALDRALRPFRILDVDVPGWDDANTAGGLLLAAEAFLANGHLLAGGRVGEDVAAKLTAGAAASTAALAAAQAVRADWTSSLRDALSRVDVLALPTMRDEPPLLEDAHRMSELRLTLPINLAGVPAVSLPLPRRDGLPASLQLLGSPGSEDVLLATAAAIETSLRP
ncbi:MAG: amidase [Pseudonocardiales bacterium]|nr:MAG: amidase [Pseudonocardiales bacterium]